MEEEDLPQKRFEDEEEGQRQEVAPDATEAPRAPLVICKEPSVKLSVPDIVGPSLLRTPPLVRPRAASRPVRPLSRTAC